MNEDQVAAITRVVESAFDQLTDAELIQLVREPYLELRARSE